MSARDEILARIRASLADVPANERREVPWEYGRATPNDDVLGKFVEMCVDYKAVVERVPAAKTAETVAALLTSKGVKTVVVPPGTDKAWRAAIEKAGVTIIDDDPPRDRKELDTIDAVVTAAAVGIAETGTVVLDHREDQGRRALSLVPDTHVCVVRADQVVSDVPESVVRLEAAIKAGRPLTWISGGSATSDIELSRVEGVHGPRNLLIVLAE